MLKAEPEASPCWLDTLVRVSALTEVCTTDMGILRLLRMTCAVIQDQVNFQGLFGAAVAVGREVLAVGVHYFGVPVEGFVVFGGEAGGFENGFIEVRAERRVIETRFGQVVEQPAAFELFADEEEREVGGFGEFDEGV